MYALRETQTAINRIVTIELPTDFPTDEVEIIVLPANASKHPPTDELANRRQHILKYISSWDISEFSAEKMQAYNRLLNFYAHEFVPRVPPPEGLWEQFVWMSDDFNAPMEDEDLWYTPIDL